MAPSYRLHLPKCRNMRGAEHHVTSVLLQAPPWRRQVSPRWRPSPTGRDDLSACAHKYTHRDPTKLRWTSRRRKRKRIIRSRRRKRKRQRAVSHGRRPAAERTRLTRGDATLQHREFAASLQWFSHHFDPQNRRGKHNRIAYRAKSARSVGYGYCTRDVKGWCKMLDVFCHIWILKHPPQYILWFQPGS